MGEFLATLVVVLLLAAVTAGLTRRYPRAVQPWVWFAFLEYLACAIVQYFYAVDAVGYRSGGYRLAAFLDNSFWWAAQEVTAVLFHQPSVFDPLMPLPGTNTASMFAATAWILFLTRGSAYATHALIAGLSMFGTLGIYRAAQEVYPRASPVRLFIGTVAFPSVAFWTSSLHKESFCVMGIGLLLAGTRAATARRFRALLYLPAGVTLVSLFRPQALPALVPGFAVYFVLRRIQKTRGLGGKVAVAPVYIAVGLSVMAAFAIFLGHIVPALALDRVVESVAVQQAAWNTVEGGSMVSGDTGVARSLGAQLMAAPGGLINGLLRPQLFDVRSFPMLISAVEMTAILWLLVRAIRLHGPVGLIVRLQQSPFLAMCTVITILGCTVVGLTTRNLGSLARYRVPFLPFYGIWLAVLSARVTARQPGPRPSPALVAARTSGPHRPAVGRPVASASRAGLAMHPGHHRAVTRTRPQG